jgi:hypothetical protein
VIIGLHGKKQAGKDTTLGYIDEYFGQTGLVVQGRSFARALKVSAAASLGIKPDDPMVWADQLKVNSTIAVIDDDTHTSHEISGREFLQYYGTEAHRDVFGENFWVDVVCPRDLVSHDAELLVFTDVRFPNEAERIKEVGGTIWQIIRPDVETRDLHASEQPLPPQLIDAVIWNDKDLNHLRNEIHDRLTFDLSMRLSPPPQSCACGEPDDTAVTHRTDGPCYYKANGTNVIDPLEASIRRG